MKARDPVHGFLRIDGHLVLLSFTCNHQGLWRGVARAPLQPEPLVVEESTNLTMLEHLVKRLARERVHAATHPFAAPAGQLDLGLGRTRPRRHY